MFLANVALIERLAECHGHRYHLRREDVEDLASSIKIKLIENGYRVLRQYKGKSKIETYLTVVVQRLVLDYFDRLWGKRRPSAAARRLGPIAIRIERLRRDGISSDEACAILRAKMASQASLGQLEAIAAQVSDRPLRRFDGEERLATLQALNASPEQRLGERERDRALARVLAALNRAVAQLPPEDRAMITLRGRLKIAAIARFLGQPEKPMYRRLEKLLRTVRRTMEREGVGVEEVEEALA